MINVGVDFGIRKIAVACFEEQWAISFKVKDDNRSHELRHLATRYNECLVYGAQLWIESAIMGSSMNVQTTVGLAATQGAIMGVHKGPCTIVAPTTWKHGVTGNGHASKDDVSAWLADYDPYLAKVCLSQDEVDAMCMALYGRMLTDGVIDPPIPKPKKKRKAKEQA